ncbi:TPA: hypothetical protein WH558_000955 [Neisseria meningitidis]|uniref:hypothetical protein n=1 Tax=Neisseria meningitidis TaxID=487 RepID=UPI0009B6A19C|nr:hypothetical protein [Neisseria meningitidis]ARB71967.1 hypothetical protein A6J54_10100 [Neisseria meningitidis]ARC10993.1 hypothetical protein A6J50_12680 [Neisseria meningitidis]
MFDKQARFRVGEFDGEKECAAGNEVSAITRHRIFGLGVGEGMACCLRFLTSLKRQTVNQATACVRTAHTLHVDFEVPCNSQVGCVAQPRTRCWVCRLRLAAAETPEEKAKDAAEEAKEEAKDAAEDAKEAAEDAKEEAK